MDEIFMPLWLADVCDGMRNLFAISGSLAAIVFCILWLNSKSVGEAMPRASRWIGAIAALFIALIIVPSGKTLNIAAAARAAQLASETELGKWPRTL